MVHFKSTTEHSIRWDRNLLPNADACAEEHCVSLQAAQREFARASQLEAMNDPAALGAFDDATDAVVHSVGVTHPETEFYIEQTDRYLDAQTPAGKRSATLRQLKIRDVLSKRLQSLTKNH